MEDAESWGHAELQPLPRRFIRFGLVRDRALRRWFASDILGWPAPGLLGKLGRPTAIVMARAVGADEAAIGEDVRRLPALLDRVDDLIAAGTIGRSEPNAADFQILSTVRVLLQFGDLVHLVEGHPAAASARRLFPPSEGPIPQFRDGSAGIVESKV